MNRIFFRLALGLLLSFVAVRSSAIAAESPLYIPFQGQVTNQAGVLATDGQYSVIFNLYDQAVGGQPVWSERHVKIGVTRGMINVFLGSIAPLTNVDFSQTKYLGITVDTDNLATTADPEMVPRSLILPAFHAKNAEKSTNSSKLTGLDWSTFFENAGGTPTNDPIGALIKRQFIPALLPQSVTSAMLANGSVTSQSIAAGSITEVKIADGSITGGKIADGAITRAKIPPANSAIATGGGTTSATSFSDIGLSVTITTTGRPVLVFVQPADPASFSAPPAAQVENSLSLGGYYPNGGAPYSITYFRLVRNSNPLAIWESSFTVPQTNGPTLFSASSLVYMDTPAAGTHTYKYQIRTGFGGGYIAYLSRAKIVAIEL